MSEFKKGWYHNTKENQEALFKLGYKWRPYGKKVSYLNFNYIYTYKEDGYLGCSDKILQGYFKGDQIPAENFIIDDTHTKSNLEEEIIMAITPEKGKCYYVHTRDSESIKLLLVEVKYVTDKIVSLRYKWGEHIGVYKRSDVEFVEEYL